MSQQMNSKKPSSLRKMVTGVIILIVGIAGVALAGRYLVDEGYIVPNPHPTSTRLPTLTPTPDLRPVILRDDFSTPEGLIDWDASEDSSAEYTEYGRLSVTTGGFWAFLPASAGQRFTDVSIEYRAEPVGPVSFGVGARCKQVDEQNYYYMWFASSGFYEIGKVIEGRRTVLADQDERDEKYLILSFSDNRLRFDCTGDELTMFVNGNKITSVKDSSLLSGDVGILVDAGAELVPGYGDVEDEVQRVYLDDFRVYGPDPSTVMSTRPTEPPMSEASVEAKAWPPMMMQIYLDFNDPEGMIEPYTGESYVSDYTETGRFFIDISDPSKLVLRRVRQEMEDVSLEFTATNTSGVGFGLGAFCRYGDSDNYYYFYITNEGDYGILREQGGSRVSLAEAGSERKDLLNDSEANRVRFDCMGEKLSAYVNGQFVVEAQDATFTRGETAFAAMTVGLPGVRVEFDHLVVYVQDESKGVWFGDVGIAEPAMRIWLEEDFSGPEGVIKPLTGVEYSGGYTADGGYLVQIDRNPIIIPFFIGKNMGDVSIHYDARIESQGAYSLGAECRYMDSHNYYFMNINSDGEYSIGKMVGYNMVPIVSDKTEKGRLDLLKDQGVNHVRFDCIGDELTAYVNGVLLATVHDISLWKGNEAFVVRAEEEAGVRVLIDNLVVWGR